MALYVTRPRRDEERIGRGLPSEKGPLPNVNPDPETFKSAFSLEQC